MSIRHRPTHTTEVKEWLTSLIGNTPFGILTLDVLGRCTLANDQVGAVFGCRADDLVDHELEAILVDWPELIAELPPFREQGRADFDCHSVPKADRVYNVRGRVIVKGMLLTFDDVTEEVRFREEQAALLGQLEAANKELAEFAFICAHDMKSPISNLSGLIARLAETGLEPGADNAMVDMLHRSVADLDETIRSLNDILAVKRTLGDADGVACLPEVVDSVLGSLEQPDKCTVSTDYDLGACDTVPLARPHLRSVMQNLLSNSMKYADPSRPPEIHVSARRTGDGSTVIGVDDNGIGVDLTETGEKLFGLFNRLHTHVEGRGVGLYLVKSIIDSYGGSVSVESEPNRGTSFRIEVPTP